MAAPQVISKGSDLMAMMIRDIAKEHGIPLLQSPVLARTLYAHGELDQSIPSTLFNAVAQVLAYVWRLKAAMRGEAAMPGELPVPMVPPELDPHDRRRRLPRRRRWRSCLAFEYRSVPGDLADLSVTCREVH